MVSKGKYFLVLLIGNDLINLVPKTFDNEKSAGSSHLTKTPQISVIPESDLKSDS